MLAVCYNIEQRQFHAVIMYNITDSFSIYFVPKQINIFQTFVDHQRNKIKRQGLNQWVSFCLFSFTYLLILRLRFTENIPPVKPLQCTYGLIEGGTHKYN